MFSFSKVLVIVQSRTTDLAKGSLPYCPVKIKMVQVDLSIKVDWFRKAATHGSLVGVRRRLSVSKAREIKGKKKDRKKEEGWSRIVVVRRIYVKGGRTRRLGGYG